MLFPDLNFSVSDHRPVAFDSTNVATFISGQV